MEKIRVVIVDDSPFATAVIRDILEGNGFDVVGTADTLNSVKEVIKDKKPALVTMDLAMRGTDGFECTRAVREIDEAIKVVFISSMMDDDVVNQAKDLNISAYIQKPFEAGELISAINRAMAVSDDPYHFLQEKSLEVFKDAFKDGIYKMTNTVITFQKEYISDGDHESRGVTAVSGITGLCSGRMLLGLSLDTAKALVGSALKSDSLDTNEMMAMLSEFNNIISGNACSTLNKMNDALKLRVAPPVILWGDGKAFLSFPSFSTYTVIADTQFGSILLNVGFKKSF